MEPAQRRMVLREPSALVAAAQARGPERFAEHMRRAVERIEQVSGFERVARRRRQTMARSWVDPDTGMWHLHLVLDPEPGLQVDGRLRQERDRLYREPVPAECPSQPLAKHGYLYGVAALNLLLREPSDALPTTAGPPRADSSPTSTRPPGPRTARTSSGACRSHDVLMKLYPQARIRPVVVLPGIVLYAAGRLELGRTTRIASQAQRRVRRGRYRFAL
jgi:hypothetical protein